MAIAMSWVELRAMVAGLVTAMALFASIACYYAAGSGYAVMARGWMNDDVSRQALLHDAAERSQLLELGGMQQGWPVGGLQQ